MSIGDICGHNMDKRTWKTTELLANNQTYLGVELEIENMGGFEVFFRRYLEGSFWITKNDESLRNNGIELVMTFYDGKMFPLLGKDVITAMEALDVAFDKYKAAGGAPEITSRTSTHLHIDVRDLSTSELLKFILLYVVFEEIFFLSCDKDRIDNQYCKPIFKTRELKEKIADLLLVLENNENSFKVKAEISQHHKYSALNIGSILNRGSLEIRLFPATISSTKIIEWINLILSIKNAAQNPNIEINNFPERVSVEGMLPFMCSIFDKYSELLVPYATDYHILKGVRIAQEILNMHSYKKLNDSFKKSIIGKKAEADSLLHKFAKVNNFEVND